MSKKLYWHKNVKIIMTLLLAWFLFGIVIPIFLDDFLNSINFFGVPLGFWFAQQGSIYVFIILIYIYGRYMNKLDEQYNAKG